MPRIQNAKSIGARCSLIREIVERMAEESGNWQVRSMVEDIQWYNGYADGQSGDAVVTGNWNDITKYEDGKHIVISDIPSRLCKLFEKAGAEVEWSDEWTGCNDCGKAIRTEPDSYSWQQGFILTDDGFTCEECIKGSCNDDVLEEYINNPRKAWTLDIDITQFGWEKIGEDYETGLHSGQTDDPVKVLKDLHAAGHVDVIFRIVDVGQFDSTWCAYVRPVEAIEDEE